MPDYIIEVKFKSIYGPFNYLNPASLKADFLDGKLLLQETCLAKDILTGVTVKEAKPEK